MVWRPSRWPFNVVTQFSAPRKIWKSVPKENNYLYVVWVKSLLKAIHLTQEKVALR